MKILQWHVHFAHVSLVGLSYVDWVFFLSLIWLCGPDMSAITLMVFSLGKTAEQKQTHRRKIAIFESARGPMGIHKEIQTRFLKA